MAKSEFVYKKVASEINQGHEQRIPLYKNLETALGSGKRVVSFFTSFKYNVVIEDDDANMLEEVLATTELDGMELVLLLNSPGGDPIAAERIVKVCRSYAKTGFSVIVPKAAKSAATMICMGADSILMSETSELGPIDPQILVRDAEGNPVRYQAAHEILQSYDDLMDAANRTKGRIEPYLQQLNRYDARDIRSIESAQDLSEDIAINLLKKGMMKGSSTARIKKNIKLFLDPAKTTDHARPVFYEDAKQCQLNVHLEDLKSPKWRMIWEMYVRLNNLTTTSASKAIETSEESYTSGAGNH